jgi:hypothetical protein
MFVRACSYVCVCRRSTVGVDMRPMPVHLFSLHGHAFQSIPRAPPPRPPSLRATRLGASRNLTPITTHTSPRVWRRSRRSVASRRSLSAAAASHLPPPRPRLWRPQQRHKCVCKSVSGRNTYGTPRKESARRPSRHTCVCQLVPRKDKFVYKAVPSEEVCPRVCPQ